MSPRGWELLGDFFEDNFLPLFEKPVTFRKLNIFWYFFKEIYLRELKTTNPGLPVTFRHSREGYRQKKWPSKQAKSREISEISDLDSILLMIGCILGGTIVAQHLRDLKTSFLMFSGGFQHRFWNFDSH